MLLFCYPLINMTAEIATKEITVSITKTMVSSMYEATFGAIGSNIGRRKHI